VPDYTILMDAVPGRVNVVWNLFDQPGEFRIQCREYCGFGHATMKAKLFVEPQTAEAAAESQNVTGQAPAQAPVQSAGPPGTPLTILEGASVQGSPNFDPDTLTVKKGDKITVTNKDTLPHTVTSGTGSTDPNNAKQFDTSIIEAGATADIQTSNLNPGQYPFYCTVHPYMTGKLVVQ
jgi:cytochrome c oxidase subunit 2